MIKFSSSATSSFSFLCIRCFSLFFRRVVFRLLGFESDRQRRASHSRHRRPQLPTLAVPAPPAVPPSTAAAFPCRPFQTGSDDGEAFVVGITLMSPTTRFMSLISNHPFILLIGVSLGMHDHLCTIHFVTLFPLLFDPFFRPCRESTSQLAASFPSLIWRRAWVPWQRCRRRRQGVA